MPHILLQHASTTFNNDTMGLRKPGNLPLSPAQPDLSPGESPHSPLKWNVEDHAGKLLLLANVRPVTMPQKANQNREVKLSHIVRVIVGNLIGLGNFINPHFGTRDTGHM